MSQQNKSEEQSRSYTLDEVALHNREGDAWIVLRGRVYDISKFASVHPAGKKIILKYAGSDATHIYELYHSPFVLPKYHEKLNIGYIKDQATTSIAELQQVYTAPLFSNIPFGDPTNTFEGWYSPYHTEVHKDLRKRVRTWAQREIWPYLEQWAEGEVEVPPEMLRKVGAAGFLALCVGKPWPRKWYPDVSVAGLKFATPENPQDPDVFCEQIVYDELGRVGGGGVFTNLITGPSIGLPPVLHFGSLDLQQRVAAPCLRGEKRICLAVTEPWAGSDVAAIRTTAVKSACGKYYTVNGMKKWISTGIYTDFISTGVRTGGSGHKGLSFLVIPRNLPGVTARKMKCQGWWASGTTFLIFENVQVPVENLIGKEGDGFKLIMYNFNHERFLALNTGLRLARNCLQEAMRYAHKRETFGKRLIDHQVIRLKLANMIRLVESCQSYVDQISYNFERMNAKEHTQILAGAIGLAKVQLTQTMEFCAREAAQIFGGLAYTRAGVGGIVERAYREVRPTAIGGGSEEIMLDFGARNASKLMPKL